jgi:hypothetical protein
MSNVQFRSVVKNILILKILHFDIRHSLFDIRHSFLKEHGTGYLYSRDRGKKR